MSLQKAINAAARAEYDDLLEIAGHLESAVDKQHLAQLASTLKAFGFVSLAKRAQLRLIELEPSATWALSNLASIEHDLGAFSEALEHYQRLLQLFPDHPIANRNLLLCHEYSVQASDAQRYQMALDWGRRLINRVGRRERPTAHSLVGRRLRIGYVSADFCQHTAGLFAINTIESHSDAVEVYIYSSAPQEDWVSQRYRKASLFRDARQLNDLQLAALIEQDQIDVLIDLSGHTSGSRLEMFALRPAPVMLTWLGYFATTGLEYIDGALLDEAHLPAGAEEQFVEPLIRLDSGRLTYTPVPWMPTEVPDYPCARNGFVTFGSFNNTNKLNAEVFDVWSALLHRVPTAKLVLKWRTLNDATYQSYIIQQFGKRGIEQSRIELRPPSFHKQMLTEYSDIDIALDPFPFTGGVTSLEALYLGRPVITWPQSRPVSRQTFAFLRAIGWDELAVSSAEAYVETAANWASDSQQLIDFGSRIRSDMLNSILMRPQQQAAELESIYHRLFKELS